ncbi:hypothetical protein RN001_000015 [Aquatica leii]|uniref:Uncharacterized protein n=1 Tax=Aquatica leii TaxID=1421715 RepID=A0AAN7Q2J1_9COLE|nr:hypothetical protein RN001_000015 [Aquatica leii]
MRSYTFYSVLVICFVQVFTHDIPDELFDKVTLECMEKVHIDKEAVKNMIGADYRITKGNPKISEQLECLGKAKHVVKEDDEFDRDVLYHEVMHTLLPLMNKGGADKHELANKVTDECVTIKNDNFGERLIDLHNCFVDAVHKY